MKAKINTETLFLWFLGLFFILAAHYLQINRSGTGLELPFNTMGWIPLFWAIGCGLYLIAGTGRFTCSRLSMWLAILACLLVLPAFLPMANQDGVLDRVTGLLAGLLLLVCLQQFRFSRDIKLLLMLLVIVSVWVEMIIAWDRFLRSVGIGISETRPAWVGDPHGIFQQRNVFASLLATGIVLSGYLLGYTGKMHDGKFQPYYVVLLLLPFAAVHLLNAMYSRTGWLGLLVGFSLVLPYMIRQAHRYLLVLWLVSLVGGFILTWQLSQSTSWAAPEKTIATVEGLRQIHFPQTMDMIKDKPLLGYGYGNFESAYLNFTAEKFATGASSLPGISRLDHPHNELLFWAAEGGIYALVLVLLAAWFVWKRVVVLPWLHRLAVIGLFFPIVLHTQLEYPFYQSVLHWVIFILFIYWVDELSPDVREYRIESTLLIRVSAFLVPVIATAFLATTLHTGYLVSRFEGDMEPNVEVLSGITNPAVYQDRINWAIMSRLVLMGAINNQPELVQPYIAWAPDLIARKPRPNFYRFLILAYKVAGDEENMNRVLQEANYLFPEESLIAPPIEAGVAAPVPFDAISR